MIKKYFLLTGLALLLIGFALVPAAGSTEPESQSDRDLRWKGALENIQAAIDEDPDEAAAFLGSTPIQNLELEALENLSDKAVQFTQLKEIERLQQQQAERRRLRELQDLQNSRP